MFQGVSLLDTAIQSSSCANTAAEWASGDVSQVVQWEAGSNGGIAYHRFWRQNQEEFRESREIASWGNWYLATRSEEGVSILPLQSINGIFERTDQSDARPSNQLTWQIGADTAVRGQFANSRQLANTQEQNFRPVSEQW